MYETDPAQHAAHPVRRTALAEGIHPRTQRPVLHGDNGSSVKGTTVPAVLSWRGIAPPLSGPQFSDDTAYAEVLRRAAMERPDFRAAGSADFAGRQQ